MHEPWREVYRRIALRERVRCCCVCARLAPREIDPMVASCASRTYNERLYVNVSIHTDYMIRVHFITRQPATDLRVRGADLRCAMRGIAYPEMHAAGNGGWIAT